MTVSGRRRTASCSIVLALVGAVTGVLAGCAGGRADGRAGGPEQGGTGRAAIIASEPSGSSSSTRASTSDASTGATPSTGPPTGPPTGSPASPDGEVPPVVDRTVRIRELKESSGLAPSVRHRGVLWSHNDSGDAARLFAIARNGTSAAVVGLRQVTSRDAEAIQTLDVPGAGPVVVLGDIGDNAAARDGKGARLPQLVVLPEPRRLRDGDLTPSLRISFRYPDGPHDAETLLADPRDQRLYVLTKGMFTATLFAVPAKVWPGADGVVARRAAQGGAANGDGEPETVTTRLTRVAELPMVLATDGAVAADGALIVRGYGSLSVFPPVEDLPGDGAVRATGATSLPPQPQGESLSLDPRHQGSVLVGSEGPRRPIYRVPLP